MSPDPTSCPDNSITRQDEMFTLLSAILWLGNVRLKPIKRGTGDDTVEVLAGPALSTAARLLGVPEAALVKALSKRNISAGMRLRQSCMATAELAPVCEVFSENTRLLEVGVHHIARSRFRKGQTVTLTGDHAAVSAGEHCASSSEP